MSIKVFNSLQTSLIALILIMTGGFTFAQQSSLPKTGFGAMEGKLIIHPFQNSADSLSGQEIYELIDDKGLPIWFGQFIFKDICMTSACKMIRLWLFWDGVGNYHGIQILNNETLTKSDHTEFLPSDYEKLEVILRDASSVLKDLAQEDLIIPDNKINVNRLDGYSAATLPTLDGLMVQDAIYTCYTLWHTVYGPGQKKIFEIIDERIGIEYFSLLFQNQNSAYKLWAIDKIKENQEYHKDFYPHILECIQSENLRLSFAALSYFQTKHIEDVIIQTRLAEMLPYISGQKKHEILLLLNQAAIIDMVVLTRLFRLYESEQLSIGDLNLIMRLVKKDHLTENNEILKYLEKLSKHENAYIRNLSNAALRKIPQEFFTDDTLIKNIPGTHSL